MLVISELDGLGPVVTPFYHSAWLQVVTSQLVNVGGISEMFVVLLLIQLCPFLLGPFGV